VFLLAAVFIAPANAYTGLVLFVVADPWEGVAVFSPGAHTRS
jgi:hypothetical protein